MPHERLSGERFRPTRWAGRARKVTVMMKGFVLAGLLTLLAVPAAADTYTVDRTDDTAAATGCSDATPNDCSLRGAIVKSNGHGGADTIVVHSGTYNLTLVGAAEDAAATGDLDVTGDLTLKGDGPATTIVDAAGLNDGVHSGDRAIHLDPLATGKLDITISGVTVRNATTSLIGFVFAWGAGILNGPASSGPADPLGSVVLLENVTLENNTSARDGGGVANFGTMAIAGSLIDGNHAESGGGIFVGDGASLEVTDSTVSNNGVGNGNGGGLMSGLFSVNPDVPAVTILRSTFNDNSAKSGGGIFQNRGAVTVVDSTISHNQASSNGFAGGGIAANAGLTIKSSTITLNTAVGGGGGLQGDASMSNSIVAGNSAAFGVDCNGTIASSTGYNLVQSTSGCTFSGVTTGNITGKPAMLAPLADNGGATMTHLPQSTSPAIDAGDPAGCTDGDDVTLAADQRGEPRSRDGDADGAARCDLGAVETQTCTGRPDKPKLLAPAEDGRVKATNAKFDWTDVACVRRYRILVRKDSSYGPVAAREQRLYTSEYTAGDLTPGDKYVWHVRVCNGAGCRKTTYSPFKVKN
jgi:hypothetical protein